MITCKWAHRNFRYIGKYLIVLSTILQLESGKGHNTDFDPSLTILQIYSQQQQLQFIFAFLTCQTSVCTAREPSAHSKIKSKEKLHNVCLKVGFFFFEGSVLSSTRTCGGTKKMSLKMLILVFRGTFLTQIHCSTLYLFFYFQPNMQN